MIPGTDRGKKGATKPATMAISCDFTNDHLGMGQNPGN